MPRLCARILGTTMTSPKRDPETTTPVTPEVTLTAEILAKALKEFGDSARTNTEVLGLVAKLVERLTEKPKDPLEMWDAQAEEFRQKIKNRPTHPEVVLKGAISPWTGAKMTVIVQKGVVCRLEDYEYPAWSEKSVKMGGRVPNELDIVDRSNGSLTQDFKHWRWVNTYKMDLQNMVGAPPHPALQSPPEGPPPAHTPIPAHPAAVAAQVSP